MRPSIGACKVKGYQKLGQDDVVASSESEAEENRGSVEGDSDAVETDDSDVGECIAGFGYVD